MKTILGVVGAGLVGSFAICELCVPTAAAMELRATAATYALHSELPDSTKVMLHVEGMTCGGCALSARLVLEKIDGVKKAEVIYEKKLAVVTYDPAKVTPEKMIAALKAKLKYTATVVSDSVR